MKNFFKLISNKIKIEKDGNLKEFPNQPGLIIFPISMAKINDEQSPEKIFNFIVEKILRKLWKGEPISILILYSVFFYKKYGMQINNIENLAKEHEFKLKKLISSVPYLEKSAYTYMDWEELIENHLNKEKFQTYLNFLSQYITKNETFENCLKLDLQRLQKEDTNENRLFLLEETVILHMILKEDTFKFKDNFTQNKNKWIILMYAGPALKLYAFLHQNDLFNLNKNSKNIFQDTFYDFKSEFLYQYNKIDINNNKPIDYYASIAKNNNENIK